MTLDEQTWWITGASSGIGAAMARHVAERGASVILSGRNVDALNALAAELPDALVLPFEMTDQTALTAAVDAAWSWRGRVDALFNNAGITQRSLAVDTAPNVYDRILAVDLAAPIALAQANLSRMVAAGGGRLIAISSIAGIIGAPLRSAYSAAKAGLIAYHDSVRAETADLGITVHVIAPGSIRTDVSRNALDASGQRRGVSDAVIDAGLDPVAATRTMLDAVLAGQRELILAEGAELAMTQLRRSDPNSAFDMVASLASRGLKSQLAPE